MGSKDSILDQDALDALRGLSGDGGGDLLGDLIDLFLSDTPGRIAKIRAAIDAQNWVDLRHVAHALKGSCSYLGATEMAETCRQIERCGRDGDGDRAAELLRDLETQSKLVCDALRRERK